MEGLNPSWVKPLLIFVASMLNMQHLGGRAKIDWLLNQDNVLRVERHVYMRTAVSVS